jgi:hypothetical protein
MKSILAVLTLALILFTAGLAGPGCVATAPGSSPFIVNVERVETIAPPAFDLVLAIDDSNRPYWRTNTPRFHAFCESLRAPVPFHGANYPASITALLQLQESKVAFKQGRGDSNALFQAYSQINLLLADAQAWATVIVKPTTTANP